MIDTSSRADNKCNQEQIMLLGLVIRVGESWWGPTYGVPSNQQSMNDPKSPPTPKKMGVCLFLSVKCLLIIVFFSFSPTMSVVANGLQFHKSTNKREKKNQHKTIIKQRKNSGTRFNMVQSRLTYVHGKVTKIH